MGDPYNSADEWGARAVANPYAAPTARVAEVFATNAFVKSTRLSRLGAVLLDTVIVVVPVIILAVVMPSFWVNGDSSSFPMVMGAIGLAWIGFAIYQLVMLYRHGQTLGKKILGIKIVRSDGSRAGLRRIVLLRYLVPGIIGAIPYVGFIFSLIDPLFIFGDEKRCVHDLMADTIVVDA